MDNYKVEDIRNIAFCGHGSSGKTTLVDKILTSTETVKRLASVDNGTSICDFDEQEKSHKYTIEAKIAHLEACGKFFNILDTPGYADFFGQTVGALSAVETAVIAVNAQSGVEANTRRAFSKAKSLGLGRIIAVTKLDAENIDFPHLVSNIKKAFGNHCVPLNIPVGLGGHFTGVLSTLQVPEKAEGAVLDPGEIHEALMDSIVEADESVMERYLEGQLPTKEELSRLIVEAVAEGTLIPIVCVSGKTGVGIPELLEGLAMCSLPPGRIKRKAKNSAGEEVELAAEPTAPLAAQVFKTRIDPFVQKISYIRVYSGTLFKDSTVPTDESRRGVKIAQLFRVQANETKPISSAGPGEIIAVIKMENLYTSTTLGEVVLPKIQFPTPMIGLAVRPKTRGDEGKLSGSLQKICEEDGTFKIGHDAQTKELVMTGMSELHLKIIQERLISRNKLEVETHIPKIPYRETIRTKGEGNYRHKKQTGGHGQFAEVHIRMFPFPKGTKAEEYATKKRFPEMKAYNYFDQNNFIWINSIVGGTIPNNFHPALEKGFLERIEKGVVANCPVQDVAVEVHFGKDHPVDSSEAAFKIASSMVFKNVFMECQPAILEPIVKMEITIPEDKVGDITSDLSSRRGRVVGMDNVGGGIQVINAECPLAEVTTYARTLSSLTGGQGSFTLEFSHYDYVLPNIQRDIIDRAQKEREKEEA